MTVHRPAWRGALALLSIGLLSGGCTAIGASAGAPGSPTATAPIRPTAIVSADPSVDPQRTAAPPPQSEPARAEPPAASIAVDGGDPVEGQLGSFTWLGAGSDAPWLNGSPIHVGPGERLTLTLAGAADVTSWTASRVTPGNRDGYGAIAIGDGSGQPVAFGAPPRGSWSVNVNVWFGDNRGSAAYYWLVDVD